MKLDTADEIARGMLIARGGDDRPSGEVAERRGPARRRDDGLLIFGLYIFVLAIFVGYQVISKVPPLLHTPLMSATNAISASRWSARWSRPAATSTRVDDPRLHRGDRRDHQRRRRLHDHRPHAEDVQEGAGEAAQADRGQEVSVDIAIQLMYLVASALFILGLRGLGDAQTARRGMQLAEVGMLLAVIATLLHHEIVEYHWIIGGLLIGSAIGTGMALWIPMTKMPERIALSHSFGGLAVMLVGVSEYYRHGGIHMNTLQMTATGFEVFLGALTFTGSLMAFGKLQGILPGRPITYPGQNASNVTLLAVAVGLVIYLVFRPDQDVVFYATGALGLLLGVLLVVPIGGADMPVVICLLTRTPVWRPRRPASRWATTCSSSAARSTAAPASCSAS
jgi:hypothetical protein